jgi:peptide/nickel transport system substrate-binding protein
MLHAIDRQEMVDTLQAGLVSIAHSYMSPIELEYPEIESAVTRYEYDPRRASQMLEDLRYSKGPDGVYRDSAGQRLTLEIRSSEGLDIQVKSAFAVAGYWQRLGVPTETLISAPQRNQDREWSTTFPSFSLIRTPNDLQELNRRRSSQTPLPENNFTGQNRTRYMNPEYDRLIDAYFATIPRPERTAVLRQIMAHISENLTEMGLFYNVLAVAVGKRVKNTTPGAVTGSTQAWNAHEWDV